MDADWHPADATNVGHADGHGSMDPNNLFARVGLLPSGWDHLGVQGRALQAHGGALHIRGHHLRFAGVHCLDLAEFSSFPGHLAEHNAAALHKLAVHETDAVLGIVHELRIIVGLGCRVDQESIEMEDATTSF